MKKVITQLAVGITMLTGMLVATTDVVAQQSFLTSGVQLRNATQLRAAKTPTPLMLLKTLMAMTTTLMLSSSRANPS